jgi:uncharacterized membrane protein (UPF0127 family)
MPASAPIAVRPTTRRAALKFMAAGWLAAWAAIVPPSAAATLPLSDLVIVTATGARHKFSVEVADTDESRNQGLMFRRALAADAGMLFDYHRDSTFAMWMRNTFIPLDMLFISSDGRIQKIHQRAVPHDETPIPAPGAVRAVLEVNGGTAARLGLKVGDRVEHAVFGQAAR